MKEPKPKRGARESTGAGGLSTEKAVPISISLAPSIWELLRKVAFARQTKTGVGRASVSDVVRSLVDRHRGELEKEAREVFK